ncbi:hypothetical protein NDU88_000520 [Pleurodeles waltl]|uniref:Uncharacterized protein n=1 Tax=Pleurodeles waltl TaxID=8319 RepID=A0AAV7S9V3_PLEWA|nr:hypothetical protein NDU88_000520 [Pleurodeles waltl]
MTSRGRNSSKAQARKRTGDSTQVGMAGSVCPPPQATPGRPAHQEDLCCRCHERHGSIPESGALDWLPAKTAQLGDGKGSGTAHSGRERKNHVLETEGDVEGIGRRTVEEEERRRSGKRQDLSPTAWRAAGVRSHVY